MGKSTLVVNALTYDKENITEYRKIIERIFKNLTIKELKYKNELIDNMINDLPITLVGDITKIKYRAIVNVVNEILNVDKDEAGSLYYTSRSVYFRKYGQENYAKQYNFYFK